MNTEPNAKKHLTPRQIINRFRKGVYVDENNEMISSAISSCGQAFDSIALSLPTTLPEKVMENLATVRLLYERQVAGRSVEDIVIEDYPRLKDLLLDLSYPPLWESMSKDKEDSNPMDILNERNWIGKYQVADDESSRIIGCMTNLYDEAIQEAGLSPSTLHTVLLLML